jgi:toxin ParE1/3/4
VRNPAAAVRVRAAILESLQYVVSFPQIGRRQTAKGIRKLVTRKYSYLVYYIVDEQAEEIVILTIRHHARNREYSDA